MLLFIQHEASVKYSRELFQYISCYCLSRWKRCMRYQRFISIHLMLLFIDLSILQQDFHIYFNTSHVTVYRRKKQGFPICSAISIHLMLLFIFTGDWSKALEGYFNTSHVTVYHRSSSRGRRSDKISIHLMLLFIRISSALINFKIDFNTSHVTVYRRENDIKGCA